MKLLSVIGVTEILLFTIGIQIFFVSYHLFPPGLCYTCNLLIYFWLTSDRLGPAQSSRLIPRVIVLTSDFPAQSFVCLDDFIYVNHSLNLLSIFYALYLHVGFNNHPISKTNLIKSLQLHQTFGCTTSTIIIILKILNNSLGYI